MKLQKINIWVEGGASLMHTSIPQDVRDYLDHTDLREMFQKNKVFSQVDFHRPFINVKYNCFTLHDIVDNITPIEDFIEMIGYSPNWRSKLRPVEKKRITIYAEGYNPMLYDTRGT